MPDIGEKQTAWIADFHHFDLPPGFMKRETWSGWGQYPCPFLLPLSCDNFKGEVGHHSGQAGKLSALHEIWAIMAAHERAAII